MAQYLRVDVSAVHRYRQIGMPHVILPGRKTVRYFRHEIDGWLNSMRVGERIELEAVTR